MGDLTPQPSEQPSPSLERGVPDHFGLGTGMGLVLFVIGFFGFGGIWSILNEANLGYFIDTVFLGTDIYQTKIITISLVPVVVGFFFCQRAEKYRLCGGLMMVLVAGAIVAAVLW